MKSYIFVLLVTFQKTVCSKLFKILNTTDEELLEHCNLENTFCELVILNDMALEGQSFEAFSINFTKENEIENLGYSASVSHHYNVNYFDGLNLILDNLQ